jgi:low affinity Fe/Cu permease
MLDARIRHGLTRIGELTARPAAFGIVALYAIAWLIFSPGTFGWGAIATLATWMMTLFITRTEHRDTEAIHAKLDELLRADGEARTELARLDEKDVEEIEAHRSETRQAAPDSSEENLRRWNALPRHKRC